MLRTTTIRQYETKQLVATAMWHLALVPLWTNSST